MAVTVKASESFHIDETVQTPKYQQIIDSICQGIERGELKKGAALPSINEFSSAQGVARDTVVKAYNQLKRMGLLRSTHGKGFHICADQYTPVLRVFLMLDAFTPYKEILYETMRAETAGVAELDVYFHHFKPSVFARLLNDARGNYARYVVMPFPDDMVRHTLAGWDQQSLTLLDINVDFPGKRCACIWQSHDGELCRALEQALDRLRRYDSVTLVHAEDRHYPPTLKSAFRRFCRRHGLRHRVIERLERNAIQKGQAYFIIEDQDLVELIKAERELGLEVGRDLGILSYNDTPVKEVIHRGISVISVDFAGLGRKAALQLTHPVENVNSLEKTRFIARQSL